MTVLKTPVEIMKELEKILYNFIWGKRDRIKRQTMIGKKEKGGITMVDIESKDRSLKAGWVKRLLEPDNINRIMLDKMLEPYGFNIELLLKTNSRKAEWFVENFKIPPFWGEVIANFNMCKFIKPIGLMNDHDYLSQLIWGNTLFQFKNMPMLNANCIKSGFVYVKDLYNDTGDFISEQDFIEKLQKKANWISEYSILKNAFRKHSENYNTGNAKYTNISNKWTIVNHNRIYCVKTQKSKFYYEILICKKFKRNYMEKHWETTYGINNTNWEDIYMNNIWKQKDSKIAEFKYKILTDIICTRDKISKWNRNVDGNCPFCNETQTTKHLLFDCVRIKTLWAMIGRIMHLDIKYKHIVFGTLGDNNAIQARNLVLNYISFSIFKMWIQSENNELNFRNVDVVSYIKKYLFSKTMIVDNRFFIDQCDKIILNL